MNSAPHPQHVVDIFKGEWLSRFPEPVSSLAAGEIPLFEDGRIQWAEAQVGGFRGKRILDLGPLEGGHSYMFEKGGALEVVAVEANTRAFLKCLATKELLGLQRVSYLCGDFMAYLRENTSRFDIINASGVLYHQRNPAELLSLLARSTDCVIMWTHYYEHAAMSGNPEAARRFTRAEPAEYGGFRYDPYRHDYGTAVHVPWFCGGTAPYTMWMQREDILGGLRHFGLDEIRISSENRETFPGPSFNLVAMRRRTPRG